MRVENKNVNFSDCFRLILEEDKKALQCINEQEIEDFVNLLISCRKVFCIGVGRVLISLEAFVKRLNHLGIEAYIVGALDEPAFTEEDVLVVASGSGASVIPVAIAEVAARYNGKVVHIGSNPDGDISAFSTSMVRIPVRTKLRLCDELESKQIMSSLFEQSLYILCDAICLMIADKKNLCIDELRTRHANLE